LGVLCLALPAQAASTSTAPATPAATTPATDSVTAGDLTASQATLKFKKDYVDIFLTIKNAGKIDEAAVGAGTPWTDGDVVEVKKDKDGKETESPVAIPLPAGKTTELSEDTVWLRAKDIKTQPKGTDVMPFQIYTRRSPNLNLKISTKSAGSGSFMDWLKK
jgi:copper(I)-binding protein